MTGSTSRREWLYQVPPHTIALLGIGIVFSAHWIVVSIANLNALGVQADVLSSGEVGAMRARMFVMLVSWSMIFCACACAVFVLCVRMRNKSLRWDIPLGRITAIDILGREIWFDIDQVHRIVVLHRGRRQLAAYLAVVSLPSKQVVIPASLVAAFGSLTESLVESSFFTLDERPGLLGTVVVSPSHSSMPPQ